MPRLMALFSALSGAALGVMGGSAIQAGERWHLLFVLFCFAAPGAAAIWSAVALNNALKESEFAEKRESIMFGVILFAVGAVLLVSLGFRPQGGINFPEILIGLLLMAPGIWYGYAWAIEENEPEEPEEEEAPAPSDQYLRWIEDHQPSLPPKAKEAYIEAAKQMVATYQRERFAPTKDELILARRKYENPPTLGEVQMAIFERYKALVDDLPKADGFPPFPLFPPHPHMDRAFRDLANGIGKFRSWTTPTPDPDLEGTDWEGNPIASTPFSKVAAALTPVQNGVKRFEGCFILAPQGSGKTNLLNYLIDQDFTYLAFEGKSDNAPSIVAMDSNGDFLRSWLPKRHFHPEDGVYRDRLVIISPSAEKPLALNPFAYGRERIKAARGDEKIALTNQAIDLLTHVFSSVGTNTSFTDRQRLFFGHCVRLCMAIPNATLQTLHDIMATASVEPYEQYLKLLSPEAQAFFQTTFPSLKKVMQEELLWRVQLVLENEAFAPMVKAPDCRLDFYSLLNSGSFVIVHCDRNLLGERGRTVFGRLVIALIRLAMKERDPIPEVKRKPVYLYIDESQDFVDDDEQVATMLNDVRKSRLAMHFATQRLANIKNSNVKDALLTSGILLAHPNPEDANTVAKYMNTDDDYLRHLPSYTFMLAARGVTKAIEVAVPRYFPDRQLTPEEQRQTREYVWKKYGYVPGKELVVPPSPPKKKVKRL